MVNFPNRPVQPGQPHQPQQPVNGPNQAGPVDATQPNNSQPSQAPQAPAHNHQENQNQVQNHPSAPIEPVAPAGNNQQQQIEKIAQALNEPQDRANIHNRLNDNIPNDVGQLKSVLLTNVRQALGDEAALKFGRKLGGDNAQKYNQLLQGFIDQYKNAPPEQQQAAMDNLVKLMAKGAVDILNDCAGC